MSDVPSDPPPTADVRWATHSDPDFLALQLEPGAPRDAMRALLGLRGFVEVAETDDLDLRVAQGCSLTRSGPGVAELLVLVSARLGATSVPLVDVDPAWLARVVEARQAAVLLVGAAVRADGSTDRELLRRDVEDGGVLAALVATDDRLD